jgi:hypothetical protein
LSVPAPAPVPAPVPAPQPTQLNMCCNPKCKQYLKWTTNKFCTGALNNTELPCNSQLSPVIIYAEVTDELLNKRCSELCTRCGEFNGFVCGSCGTTMDTLRKITPTLDDMNKTWKFCKTCSDEYNHKVYPSNISSCGLISHVPLVKYDHIYKPEIWTVVTCTNCARNYTSFYNICPGCRHPRK